MRSGRGLVCDAKDLLRLDPSSPCFRFSKGLYILRQRLSRFAPGVLDPSFLQAANMGVIEDYKIESWTLYACGCLVIFFRLFARWRVVGFQNFCLDDYLMLLALVSIEPVCR